MKQPYKYFLLLALILTCSTSYAQGIYLHIRDITTGSGLTGPHADEVKLTSAQMGMERQIESSAGGPREASKLTISEYSLTKDLDISSTKIMNSLALGMIIPRAFIRYYNGEDRKVSEVELEDVLIASYSASSAECGGGCPMMSESFSLNFAKIKTTHNMDNRVEQVFTWNLETNTP
ncbi:type VI secretion system tube protein Hcp [Dyadobacter tibetensis]|uniref:type VI secretion system tube protein Hcp n=1 Tax=Dyadobacter tibetensis TaxID=1211851 RepID=UPI000471D366|nr:type VI secretion system tube protein Hcp [Dyadobacter tibetensis]